MGLKGRGCSYLEIIILLICLNGLWRHVVDGPTSDVSLYTGFLGLNPIGYSKINQAQLETNTDEILRLEIVVDHSLIMNHLGYNMGVM